ncbi:sulfite exporter TauE/SafE family protein [Ferruginibacter sp. HRS2-29]|uniref:sulfite exporter TauE/SafE family protein n=1 Tax=Ferruginibacter sp. HRS2-29 TaxID=2487334 RepID=UPI0020CE7F42|nr:sulfite exporter TauE/SafE family protein [Ferruginibacter sp. HRS2-29]MCP9753173.1 sulfite exporter TauE/SafE family protein [Ferruginibacter sp. HRS2-29]
MQLLVLFLAALVGVSLGVIGGGGSILTVPILVYIVGINPLLATSYSLFIVGATSLVGAFNSWRQGHIKIKTAILFGTASISTVFATRKLLVPLIPHHIARIGKFEVTASLVTMVLFAILMLAAAIAMIKNGSNKNAQSPPTDPVQKIRFSRLLFYGVAIGLATGFLGAGGGFLLIPTLVLLMGLTMQEAIGTSLLIIALNSLIGFTGDIGHFAIDWVFLLKITAVAIAGIFAGGYIGRRTDTAKLKKLFGWFVLLMGIYILIHEIYAG